MMNRQSANLMAFVLGPIFMVLALGQYTPRSARTGLAIVSLPEKTATDQPQATTIEFGGPLGFSYSPSDVFILPGESVKWQGDFTMHPLVSDEGLWQMVDSGSEFDFTFNQPGVYHYHCFFHGALGMSGTVTVGFQVGLPLIQR